MTISSQTRKAGPFVGSGSTGPFAFAFKIFQPSDMLVVKVNNTTSVETTLVLTTDFTVSLNFDQNSNPGGNVTLVAPLASGYNMVMSSQIPYLQETDLTNQGGFYPEVITNSLDNLTIQTQQLKEEVDRSAKLPITSVEDAAALAVDIIRLGDSAANIDIVANNITSVNTDAAAIANINTVAGAITNVNSVGTNIANVNTNATNIAIINTVAAANTNVNLVGNNIASVNTTATNIASINTNTTNIVAIQNASANATTATTQAGIATTQAGIATTQASNASASAASAAASLASFQNTYLGAFATDPTLDPHGGALTAGDLYFNTASNRVRVYSGATWSYVALDATVVVAKDAVTGNVGIGTSSSTSKLTVLGTSSFYASTNANAGSGYLLSITGANAKISSTDNTNFAIFSNDALASNPLHMTFSVVGNPTTASRYAYIQASEYGTGTYSNIALNPSGGNVGIGTASPASRLDVKSTAAGTADMRLSFSASDYMGLSSESDGYQLAAVGGTNALRFAAGGSQRMRISSTGNVGINNTNPADTLDVVGNIRISSASLLRWVDAGTVRSSIQGDASSNLIISTASTERMRIDSGGNVGIGATPFAYGAGYVDLWIQASTTPVLDLAIGSTRTGTFFASSTAVNFGTVAAVPLIINTANTEKMRISSSGNVGINNTNPADTLDVIGNIRISSASLLRWVDAGTVRSSIQGDASSNLIISTASTERMRIDSVGNTYVENGNLWQYSPAPTALAAGANAGTAAQLRSGMFSAAQTTAVTLTMPTGTAIDTGFSGVPAVDIGFYFYVINTGSALGAVTVAVNTNVTSLGSLVVAIGTSAQFRLRRTAANTYIMYRLS